MLVMEEVETCCVADQFCSAAANFTPRHRAGGRCFHCGLAVCSFCSSKRKYEKYGVVRLCNNCQIGLDGRDRVVMRRLYRLAGYSRKEVKYDTTR